MTAITDFASLKAAVLDETQRNGNAADVARLPRFVQAAEQMIEHGTIQTEPVRVADMETDADLTVTDGAATLPADFLEQVRAYWDSDLNVKVSYRTPQDFFENRDSSYSGGYPLIYTTEGTSLLMSPAASGTIKLRYYAKYDPLALDADTNWLLVNSQVYFHGSCYQAFKFLRNDAKASEHLASYVDAVTSLHRANERKRTGGRHLAPRIPRANVKC